MGKVIAIASGKGGTGKSFFTINIGAVIAKEGKKVLIVDANTGARCQDLILRWGKKIDANFIDVLDGRADIEDAIIQHCRNKNLYLLPGSIVGNNETFDCEEINALLERLAEEYDYVLVDCPPGVGTSVIDICRGADAVIVILTSDPLAVRCAHSVIMRLRKVEMENIFLVVNRMSKELIECGDMMDENDIRGILTRPLFGTLLENPKVLISINSGKLFINMFPNSALAKELKFIGRKLILVSESSDYIER